MTGQTQHAPREQKHQRQEPARDQAKPVAQMAEQPDLLALQRAALNPAQAAPGDILALQRTAGNRAVSRLIQTKLTVGGAGDRYEQEADRVAEQVVSGPVESASQQPGVQRQEEEEEVQTKPLAATITPLVQRQEDEEEIQTKPLLQRQEDEEEIQTKPLLQRQTAADGSFEAGPSIEKQLAAHRGGGSPLPDQVRGDMESRFGTSFGSVRVHTDAAAVQMNRDLSAQAFTHGPDIYIRPDQYNPSAEAGKKLLAHELTHVVQQGGGSDRIARWGHGPPWADGTPHPVLTREATGEMDAALRESYGEDALEYLASHSDHMDGRLDYLLPVFGYMRLQQAQKIAHQGMYKGGEKRKFTRKDVLKLGGKKMSPEQEATVAEGEMKRWAIMYDNAEGYKRGEGEAPNHAEGGMYQPSRDGVGRDRERIDEYLNTAVAQWKSGNPRQSLYTLALALHTAQDVGAHEHGRVGTGHDPRKFFPPPNEFATTGWVYHEKGEGKFPNIKFWWCDNKEKNPDGWLVGKFETKWLLDRFNQAVGGHISETWKNPNWLKRQIRGAGRFFGGRGIIKHK